MISLTTVRGVFLLPLMFVVTGCQEDERACYEKILADLEETADWASSAGHHERAIAARESILSALVIFQDDDRSICDYVTADVYLQRK